MVTDSQTTVSFAGKGIKMDQGSDAQPIVDAIDSCKDLQALVLEGNTMGVQAAELIGKSLAKHPEFKKHLGAGIIVSSANLVELDLSDNAFGPIGVKGISDLLHSSSCYSLQELRLNNNGLGPNGGKMLASVLDNTYEASCKAGRKLALKVFVSGRGRLENEGAQALSQVFKKMGSLEHVSMPQNGINPPGITALSQAFSHNPNLCYLNLCDNTFTATGAQAMAQALPQLKNLEVLNLESCLIRTAGAKAIGEALDGDFPNLKEVNCNYNEISRSGAVALVETVALLPSIETLELDGNSLGEEGKELVAATLETAGKSSLVPSLEEDEGTEDEEEGEEDDEAGDNVSTNTENRVIPKDNVTPEVFMETPSPVNLCSLQADTWAEFVKKEIASLSDDVDRTERFVYLCAKLGCALNQSQQNDVKSAAFALCDKALEVISTEQPSASIFSNSILVNLGLIKSENKKFKLADKAPSGPLMIVDHIVQSDFFPSQSAKTLHFYITKFESKLEGCFQAKTQLLQTLFALS